MYGILLSKKFFLDTTNHIDIDWQMVKLFLIILAIVVVYFLSNIILRHFSALVQKFSTRIGIFSRTKEYALQRFVYQHRNHPISRLYSWVNIQLIALDFKRRGVSPIGYLLFWGFISIILGISTVLILGMSMAIIPLLIVILFICLLIFTRVLVSERLEAREEAVMNAIDLIVPEIGNGVKNAILTYRYTFADNVKDDFEVFLTNIQDRGYTFNDAMINLADSLGPVFLDFAQKAMYFERVGEKEMVDIFSDIVETNRLRRQLRDENKLKFQALKSSFIVSTIIVVGYFFYLMFTDDWSRNFFLHETGGQILLILMLLIIFLVLAFVTTIRSRNI